MIQSQIEAMTSALQQLLGAEPHAISSLLTHKPVTATVPGVYLISCPDRLASIVYAGRTKTKTVLGRLADHCRCKTPSDLAGMLLRYPSHAQDARSYQVRWLPVSDDIERAQLELFTIAILKPPFNRYI